MSNQYYLRDKCLHRLPKLSTEAKVIQVGNGESVNILLIIPNIITIQGHIFGIHNMGFEIHDSVDLVLGVQNFVQLEGEISMRYLILSFLNRAISIFPYTEKR